MNTPYAGIAEMQLAAFEWATIAMTRSVQFWFRLGEMQMHMLGLHPVERRDHVEIAHGASFRDHYGRRAHDIDPEHDV